MCFFVRRISAGIVSRFRTRKRRRHVLKLSLFFGSPEQARRCSWIKKQQSPDSIDFFITFMMENSLNFRLFISLSMFFEIPQILVLVNTWPKLNLFTLPETNIAPATLGLEDEFPFGARPIFRCELLVSGSVSIREMFKGTGYIDGLFFSFKS